MAKPLIVPTFATDALYPASAEAFSLTNTKTAPPGGKLAEGFEPKEKPAAQYLNWLLHYLGQWAAYLDSGALEGDFSITGNLDVGGGLTVAGYTTLHDTNVIGDLGVTSDLIVTGGVIADGFATDFGGNLQIISLIGHGEDSVTDLVVRAAPRDPDATFGFGPSPTVTVSSAFVLSIHTPPLRKGCHITKIRISGFGTVGSTAPTFEIKELGFTGSLSAAKPFTTGLVGAPDGIFEYTLTITTPAALADGAIYVVNYTPAGGVPSSLRSITTFFARTV
jgi:hypothetical protein